MANITTPLLGLVDTAVTGHLGSEVYIAAIAIGGNIFNMLYWPMGFLRMGTSGMTAQAAGQHDTQAQTLTLYRGLVVAIIVSAALILMQTPLLRLILMFMNPDATTAAFVEDYFCIVIWGAPAVLTTYVVTGWLLGMQTARKPMIVSIVINVVNISISPALAFGADMKLEGVAIGTLVAQWCGAITGLAMCRRYRLSKGKSRLFNIVELKRYFKVNIDIILRTLCLIAVTLWFTREGARQGELTLAVNALLMQLFILFSYMIDGFAYAGEAIAGRLTGERDWKKLRQCVKALMTWGLGFALMFSSLYFLGGEWILGILTDNEGVLSASLDYLPWAMTVPMAGFMAFTWDGIYIGMTATRQMLVAMFVAMSAFFGVYFLLMTRMGNHALWLAFIIYLLLRGVVQTFLWRKIFNNNYYERK